MSDKNADGQAGQEHRTTPSQEGHAAGPACSTPKEILDIVKQTGGWSEDDVNKMANYIRETACSASDEALIEEVAVECWELWRAGKLLSTIDACRLAIREYIRRSAGKERDDV